MRPTDFPSICSRSCRSAARGAAPAPSEASGDEKDEQDLASGRAKRDPLLGLVYLIEPGDADDLTQIKGIASVISNKLNHYGIYKFKQIARWKEILG